MTKQIIRNFNPSKNQGSSLVMTLIVLLVLTMLAISSTSSNRLQSVMARNNQFQLEAWNSSYLEINARLRSISERKGDTSPPAPTGGGSAAAPTEEVETDAGGVPDFILGLVETGENDVYTPFSGDSTETVLSKVDTNNATLETGVRLVKIDCFDETIGFSAGVIGTNDLIMQARTTLHIAGQATNEVGISSDQRQRFGVNFTFGQKGVCTPQEEVKNDLSIPS